MGRPAKVSSMQAARERSRHDPASEGKKRGSAQNEIQKKSLMSNGAMFSPGIIQELSRNYFTSMGLGFN